MKIEEILSKCDHTLLSPTATEKQIAELCDDGIKYGVASVCIPPSFVKFAKGYADPELKICTVIGFPLGYQCANVKAYEAAVAAADGADEIDMVINLTLLKDRKWDLLEEEIRAVRASIPTKVLKVIIEACLLNDEEKEIMCTIVKKAGADFIKTSTGFSTGGATRADVALLKRCAPDGLLVKAAGGISSLKDAEDFIDLGADRLGTSKIVKIAKNIDEGAGDY